MADEQKQNAAYREIPSVIWMLGFVSLLMDLSSELIHSLLPVFLTTTLGASTLTLGWIEGIAEATASIVKIFSGMLSDAVGKKKLLAVIGYGLAAFTKPLFPLAASAQAVFAARFLDRIGKGIRGAPRDALVAELAPKELRGASFGLRQALDTVGACLGPLLAVLFVYLTAGNIRFVLWLGVVPAVIAVLLLIFGVAEPEAAAGGEKRKNPLQWQTLKEFRREYWLLCAVFSLFTLARFSEAFLVLKAQQTGLTLAAVPLVMVVMNITYAASAYPAGVLSDRFGRNGILIAGIVLLITADLILAANAGVLLLLLGSAVWGLHMGFTQGIFSAMVTDASSPEYRGTAFGIFQLIGGLALLGASVLAGALWQSTGPQGTFLAGAALSFLSLLGILGLQRKLTIV